MADGWLMHVYFMNCKQHEITGSFVILFRDIIVFELQDYTFALKCFVIYKIAEIC